jgi:hypothetical protein
MTFRKFSGEKRRLNAKDFGLERCMFVEKEGDTKWNYIIQQGQKERVLSLSGFNVRQRYEAIDDWSQFKVHYNEWTRVHSTQSSRRSTNRGGQYLFH